MLTKQLEFFVVVCCLVRYLRASNGLLAALEGASAEIIKSHTRTTRALQLYDRHPGLYSAVSTRAGELFLFSLGYPRVGQPQDVKVTISGTLNLKRRIAWGIPDNTFAFSG